MDPDNMKIKISSFVLIILGISVNYSFAYTALDSPCQKIILVTSPRTAYAGTNGWYVDTNGYLQLNSGTHAAESGNYAGYDFKVTKYYWSGSAWYAAGAKEGVLLDSDIDNWPYDHQISSGSTVTSSNTEAYTYIVTQTCTDCQAQYDAKEAECISYGAILDESSKNDETCSAQCKCESSDYVFWNAQCVYCPSGTVDVLSGICIGYCDHGTGGVVGELINDPNFGTCVVPGCGLGETLDENGVCQNNCSSPYMLDQSSGECTLNCADGYHEFGTDCVPDCPDGYTEDENGVCRNDTPVDAGVAAPSAPEPSTSATDPSDPDNGNEWLEKIKKNTDEMISQGNSQTTLLQSIAENEKAIAGNTKVIADGIDLVNHNLKTIDDNDRQRMQTLTDAVNRGTDEQAKTTEEVSKLGSKVDGVKDAVEQGTGDIVDAINAQKYEGEIPEQIQFDTALGEEKVWNEYDDSITMGQQRATQYQGAISDIVANNQIPIEGSLTVSGSPYISGDVTIHGHTKNIQIAFNKAWMLEGYAIMKVVLLGVGCLQSGMLVLRAFGGA
jgi:hypothetical protein